MADDIGGIPVMLHDRCLNCGSNVALVGPRRLLCDGCGCSRGRISKELRTFLEKFAQQHGWPEQPIILRTGKVFKPEQRAVAAELKPKRQQKAKRK